MCRELIVSAIFGLVPFSNFDPNTVDSTYEPGSRTLLSAHNCYPYAGMWSDRIDRALSTGFPLSIEQDLCWTKDPETDQMISVVAHNGPFSGNEPKLDSHFFERIRSDVEASIERSLDSSDEKLKWPLVVLDLDVKNKDIEHVRSIYQTLHKYRPWLSTCVKGDRIQEQQQMNFGPVLVWVGGSDNEQTVFYDELQVEDDVIAFGRAPTKSVEMDPDSSLSMDEYYSSVDPFMILDVRADNYHRWWNNSWSIIEVGGVRNAGNWTEQEKERLNQIVDHAHELGYFIRFYTMNGHTKAESVTQGIGNGYNSGSIEHAKERWESMIRAGVDCIASDQYEAFDSLREEVVEE